MPLSGGACLAAHWQAGKLLVLVTTCYCMYSRRQVQPVLHLLFARQTGAGDEQQQQPGYCYCAALAVHSLSCCLLPLTIANQWGNAICW